MAFSVNTNLASLQAQSYLKTSSDFQAKTINRVTSGLRIVSSGDDAAGLAIANSFRSDQAVLTQGIRNANDGLSTLQTIDGGMSNISQLLDRARTLATQSASGTFLGDRNVLNSEFQSVLTEVNRQAQSIGLDQGGQFAKSLAVFIGGGKAHPGTTDTTVAINNGSAAVDLSASTVDSKSLGLSGMQALGNAHPASGATSTVDIGTGSANTSVAKILTDSVNTLDETNAGYTQFYFTGPGFSDPSTGSAGVMISVNLSGVTDTGTLATAINAAITNTGNGTTQQATAFKNANITASINTDSAGRQQLAFSSGSSAFQVTAGDKVANALMGNFVNATVNADAVTAKASFNAGAFTGPTGVENVKLNVYGLSQGGPVSLSFATANLDTGAMTATKIQTAIDAGALKGKLAVTYDAGNTRLVFTGPAGGSFDVRAAGDNANFLGLGSWLQDAGANTEYSTITGGGAGVAGNGTLEVAIGDQKFNLGNIVMAAPSVPNDAANEILINTAISTVANAAGGEALKAAGLTASISAGVVTLSTTTGTKFRLNQHTLSANAFGFGANIATAGASTAGYTSQYAALTSYNSGGAESSKRFLDDKQFAFKAMNVAGDKQTLNVAAVDSNGNAHALSVDLDKTNAYSLDAAIATINTKLQQSNDATLQKMYAVKDVDAINTTEGVRFLSSTKFKVTVGSTASQEGLGDSGGVGATYQGEVLDSKTSSGGSLADISNQSTAQTAVTALANAVTKLGNAQAVVGKGQNNFNFAINLAQSQLTNLAAAESRIRDADLAYEAANLTKAQILVQAGTAALAQANSAPQAILSLLRG